jgi:uncharacterized protein YbjQ (UPF0145 family)
MICPLCGHQQSGNGRECLQCHTPIMDTSTDDKPEYEAVEETDAIIRLERRRKVRARGDQPVNRDRVDIRRRETDQSASSESSHSESLPRIKQPKMMKPGRPPSAIRIPAASRPQPDTDVDDEQSSGEPLPPPVRAVKSVGPPHVPPAQPVPVQSVPVQHVIDGTPSQSGEQLNQLVDRLKRVIVTTTPEVQGRPVKEYKGVVSTGSVVKLEGWASYLEGVKDIGSLRHAPFDAQIRKAREVLITDLKIEAAKLDANGVVGMTVQLHPVQQGAADRLLWLVAIGTAVVLPE